MKKLFICLTAGVMTLSFLILKIIPSDQVIVVYLLYYILITLEIQNYEKGN